MIQFNHQKSIEFKTGAKGRLLSIASIVKGVLQVEIYTNTDKEGKHTNALHLKDIIVFEEVEDFVKKEIVFTSKKKVDEVDEWLYQSTFSFEEGYYLSPELKRSTSRLKEGDYLKIVTETRYDVSDFKRLHNIVDKVAGIPYGEALEITYIIIDELVSDIENVSAGAVGGEEYFNNGNNSDTVEYDDSWENIEPTEDNYDDDGYYLNDEDEENMFLEMDNSSIEDELREMRDEISRYELYHSLDEEEDDDLIEEDIEDESDEDYFDEEEEEFDIEKEYGINLQEQEDTAPPENDIDRWERINLNDEVL